MDIRSAHRSDQVHVIITGEIDMETVEEVRRATTEAIGYAGVRVVLVDMAGVTFCDSSGIAAFDEAHQMAVNHGVRFRLADVQPGVSRVLEIVGLLDPLTGP